MEESLIFSASIDSKFKARFSSLTLISCMSKDEAKRKVFTRDSSCGFHSSFYDLQVPIIFHVVSVGFHYPFNRHWAPHFLPNLTHLSQYICTPFLPKIFQFWYYLPQFLQFLCIGLLHRSPIVTPFILRATCRTPVMGLSVRGCDVGT